jgi:hypothetical protein
MLTERFENLLNQHLQQSPVHPLSPRTLPLALPLILPCCPMSTFDYSQRLLSNVPEQRKAQGDARS